MKVNTATNMTFQTRKFRADAVSNRAHFEKIHNVAISDVANANHISQSLDLSSPVSIAQWFPKNYPNEPERVPAKLLSSFGADWPLKGRDSVGDELLALIEQRFAMHGTVRQIDKLTHKIPFVGSIPGGGKSALNQNMVELLQSRAKHKQSMLQEPLHDCVKLLLTFTNGSSILKPELRAVEKRKDYVTSIFAYRILYCYFVQDYNKPEVFEQFVNMMLKQSSIGELSVANALRAIELDIRTRCGITHKTIMIYLGIDEYQKLDKPWLEMIAYELGAVMSISSGLFLIPLFTGTDFSYISTAIAGSTYKSCALKFSLPYQPQVNELMDELAHKYSVLKYWRLWSSFRRHLEDFGGFMRGIEYFIEALVTKGNSAGIDLATDSCMYLEKAKHIDVSEAFLHAKFAIKHESFLIVNNSDSALVLLQHSLLRDDVNRDELLPNGFSFEYLESKGLLILEYVPATGNFTVRLPFIFLSIFLSRYPRVVNYKTFTDISTSQSFEKFNQLYDVFVESTLATSKKCITVAELYKGALFTPETGQMMIPLCNNPRDVSSIHQFPNNNGAFSEVARNEATGQPESIWSHNSVVLNAPSAPFADIFKMREKVFVATQVRFGDSKNSESISLQEFEVETTKIVNGFSKLQQHNAYQVLENNAAKQCKLLTVLKTSKPLTDAAVTKINEQHGLVVVSKNQFRSYYGDTFADRAWFAGSQNFVRVNEMEFQDLKSFGKIGNAIASSIVHQRLHAHFTDWKDLISRVNNFPKELESVTQF